MDSYYMKDYYNYKRLYDLNNLRLNYILDDIRNINLQIESINLEIATLTQSHLNKEENDETKTKEYNTKYLTDLNEMKNTFKIKLNECKFLQKKLTINVNYYDELMSTEISIINDYVQNSEKSEFKKLFPDYDSYKENWNDQETLFSKKILGKSKALQRS